MTESVAGVRILLCPWITRRDRIRVTGTERQLWHSWSWRRQPEHALAWERRRWLVFCSGSCHVSPQNLEAFLSFVWIPKPGRLTWHSLESQWVVLKDTLYTLNIDKYFNLFLFLENVLYLRKPKDPKELLIFQNMCVNPIRWHTVLCFLNSFSNMNDFRPRFGVLISRDRRMLSVSTKRMHFGKALIQN